MLTIESHAAQLDESFCRQHPDVIPGNYVLLAVSDTGHGMDQETQQHLFDPFYTTKKVGKGTGLGLATVYGIVKQSDGYVWAYSELGHGTTVKIYLPQSGLDGKPQEKPQGRQQPLGGTETILLVEDDKSLRELAVKMLKGYGYFVIEARNGQEALTTAAEEEGLKIDLLVSCPVNRMN